MKKKKSDSVYPLSAVRRLALHAQRLARKPDAPPTAERIYAAIDQIGCVQLDTLQLVQRSHYLALWSRVGTYDPALLDQVAYGSEPERQDRKLYEYWLKEACLIPLSDYRYSLPTMRYHREGDSHWFGRWLADPNSAQTMELVMQRIREEGALRGSDFKYTGPRRGSWWDWKPAKFALEVLYTHGRLMILDRVNFQRVYDLTERVLPDWVDRSEPTPDEAARYRLARAARALGICAPLQAADYVRIKRTHAKPHLDAMLKSGELVQVKAQLNDGQTHTLVIHRDTQPLLEQAADSGLKAEHTTFLSPFDNLFWGTRRDEQFWGFRQVLEAYKPEPLRQWGYFCLPILHGERLVGRFDPKLERKTGLLRLKSLYLEPGEKPTDELVRAVADALRDFMRFHNAKTVRIERSDPPEFGLLLERALA